MQVTEIKHNFFLSKSIHYKLLTGVAGFEPTNGGVKVHSLTTWRHPKILEQKIKAKNIEQEGIRTPDTVDRNHVL